MTDKGKELLNMMKQEVINNRLRDVIEFEVNYERKVLIKELEEKNNELSKRDTELSKRDDENKRLKAILKQHNIDY